jgi:hypothetical protein
MTWRALVATAGLCVGTGCTDGPPEEVGTQGSALVAVTWTNVVGASAVGSDLTKTATTTLWNAGASSVESLPGDGYVEFSTGETTTDKMAGLGNGDSDQGYADIAFAIRLNSNGGIAVFESGTQAYQGGTYAAGDRLRVQARGGVITYWKNGAVFYTSAASSPSFPLVVDTSLRTPGATLTSVEIEDLRFWQSARNVVTAGNDVVKLDATTSWNAGAVSIATLSGDGFVQFTTGENTTDKVAGLSNGNDGPGYADIDFGVRLNASGRFAVFEGGDSRGGFGSYVAGDVFRVQVESAVVTYWKNGILFYTSAAAPSFPLLLDTALRTPGATIERVQVFAGLGDAVCVAQAQVMTGLEFPGNESGWRSLGYSVDAAPGLLVAAAKHSGPPRVVVYRQGASGWEVEQELTRNDGGPSYEYADHVETDGQVIAVSGLAGNLTSGRVFVYRHDGQAWVDDGSLPCSASIGGDVAVRGDLLAAGPADSFNGVGVTVFRREATGWVLDGRLPQGTAVAMGGDRIFVGAPLDSTAGTLAGAVYVYRRGATADPPTCGNPTAGPWQLEAVLHPSNSQPRDWFGADVQATASGTEVLVGNIQFGTFGPEGESLPNGPGTVHQFTLTDQGWRETFKFDRPPKASDQLPVDSEFGKFIGLGGPDPDSPSFVVIGAGSEDAAWIFRHVGGGSWSLVKRIGHLPQPAEPGVRVAATDDSAIVATPYWGSTDGGNIGAVYDFDVLACPAP